MSSKKFGESQVNASVVYIFLLLDGKATAVHVP